MLLAMTYDLCHGGHMVAEYIRCFTPPLAPNEASAKKKHAAVHVLLPLGVVPAPQSCNAVNAHIKSL
jgi:hypothetical protein